MRAVRRRPSRACGPMSLLAGLCLLLYLPGISAIPPLDRDEARFAQATRQMLETGDFLRIRFQDEARNKKPAGIYWLQAAAVSAFSTPASDRDLALPRALAARRRSAAVLLTFALGAALFGGGDRSRGASRAIAAVLLASALGSSCRGAYRQDRCGAAGGGDGRPGSARSRLRARAHSGRACPLWIPVVFWTAEIAAIFLKGPPGPGLAVVTAAGAGDRRSRLALAARPPPGGRHRLPRHRAGALADRDRACHRGPLSRRRARPRSHGES